MNCKYYEITPAELEVLANTALRPNVRERAIRALRIRLEDVEEVLDLVEYNCPECGGMKYARQQFEEKNYAS